MRPAGGRQGNMLGEQRRRPLQPAQGRTLHLPQRGLFVYLRGDHGWQGRVLGK